MNKSLFLTNRKDIIPEETIFKIKNILDSIDLQVNEVFWTSYNNLWHSVRLEIDGLPHIGVNGKGVTRSYALASAYGELMERLQSRIIIQPEFGVFNYSKCAYHDEFEMSPEEFEEHLHCFLEYYANEPNIKLLNLAAQKNSTLRHCIPFFSLTERNIKNLPYKLINLCCGSNGLCAGNTKEEAIVQGISEIFERYVHNRIFNQSLEIFDISLDSIKSLHSFSLIQEILNAGYEVYIKDCSLDYSFPVIGLLVLTQNKDRYKFVLGCDADIDIAIQRCITELFQGHIFDSTFETKLLKINWCVFKNFQKNAEEEWTRSTINNSGHHPISIFMEHKKSPKLKYFLNNKNKENKKYLTDILIELDKMGLNVFVRDYSYLGFPCYRVYIPSLSEWRKLSAPEISYIENEYRIRKTFLNLKSSSLEDLLLLKETLVNLQEIPKYALYNFSKSIGKLIIDKSEEDEKFNLNYILYLINIQLNNKTEAFNHLERFINGNENQFEDIDYIQTMRFFLINNNPCEHNVNCLINQKKFKKISLDYQSNQTIKQYELSTCPDCQKCPIQNCYYRKWFIIDKKLKEMERKTALTQNFI